MEKFRRNWSKTQDFFFLLISSFHLFWETLVSSSDDQCTRFYCTWLKWTWHNYLLELGPVWKLLSYQIFSEAWSVNLESEIKDWVSNQSTNGWMAQLEVPTTYHCVFWNTIKLRNCKGKHEKHSTILWNDVMGHGAITFTCVITSIMLSQNI